jgi:thymidylate kinase
VSTTRIFAFCGVDGAGKSTIVDTLQRRGRLRDAVYVRRPKPDMGNSALLRRYFRRHFNDGRDWISGPFAEAMGIALAFEFLDHYDRNVTPLLGQHPVIISDRYALCFEAYLWSIRSEAGASALFAGIQPPTHTFYVHVDRLELANRQCQRGGIQDDENPEVMRRFDEAYRELLASSGAPHTFVDNNGRLDDSVAAIERRLQEFFP